MGIQIWSALAGKHAELSVSTGVEISDINSQRYPTTYVSKVIALWFECHPTWKQLLDVLQDVGLADLSQQIEAFMRGKTGTEIKHWKIKPMC